MRPPVERDPASGVIALLCLAVLLIVLGIAIATQPPEDHYPSSPTNTEETHQ